MSPIIVGIVGLIILFALLAIGLPISVGMALVGFAGYWYLVSFGAGFSIMSIVPFDAVFNYTIATLPLFLIMAQVTFVTGISKDLYNLANKWLGHFPGGIAMASVGACAGFAAVSASSLATAATMGLVALPEMKRLKYDPMLSTGAIAAGGTIGILIPPSGMLIIYGVLTEQSIGKLFMAGIIPGIMEALFYIITIYILCSWNPTLGPRGPRSTWREKFAAFKNGGEILGLIILVLGGLIIGWFTPTEAGAIGAFGAILFPLLRKRLTWKKLAESFLQAMKTTGMIYGILIGAFVFNYFIAVSQIPTALADYIGALPLSPLVIMIVILAVYLVLGCFLDAAAMIFLTIPVFFPLAVKLGFNPIWFGIILTRVMEMAMITPPIGMSVYVIAGVAPEVEMSTIFKGIFPFLIADIVHVSLLLFFPAMALFLPNLVG
ncbi:MAG: TRAP transporter large permease [Deltaproteobacteria bacterium]|nr:TRAP transporter large permease [Deltaproteobacteria bacterium]